MANYPKCKYNKANPGGVIVQTELEEKTLGPKWFDHPADAAMGKVLSNVERGAWVPGFISEEPKEKPSVKA